MKLLKVISVVTACVLVFGVLMTGCRKGGDEYSIYSYWEYDDDGNVIGEESGDKKDDHSSSDNKSGDGKGVVSASFERAEDGTSVDKATGAVFLDDDLDNWNKVYEHGKTLQFDSNEPALFDADASRVVRLWDDAGYSADAWFSYKLAAGISEFGIVTFWSDENDKVDGFQADDSTLIISVSKDYKTWTNLTSPKKIDSPLGFSWYKREYRFYNIDKANLYVKITLANKKGASVNPNISRIRINNIDKMNDVDRFLEGRASATYYVDAQAGSDRNSGTSQNKAFKSLYKVTSKYYQPGDKILFKSGQSFNGSLTIKGYGDAKNGITIGTYGGSAKAKIKARGGSGITLMSDYTTVENLEITNPQGTVGIYVLPGAVGCRKNITIQNCYIHDVNTNETAFNYETGGIIVYADGVSPTWMENVIVKNNVVENVARTGILLTTQWANRPGRWGKNNWKSDTDGWYPFEKCRVEGNTVQGSRGDAIMCCGCRNLVIEKNSVNNAFSTTKQKGVAVAALWTTNTNDSIIQYNDVGHTKFPAGCVDGEGFDIDISEIHTTLQYNYSHDNGGGFLLLCNLGEGKKISKNHVIRFNLSVNDATTAGQGVFMISDSNPHTQIYNNTIYIGSNPKRTVQPVYHFGEESADFTFTNNIFYGDVSNTYEWKNGGFPYANFKYDNNIFVNVGSPEYKEIGASAKTPGITVTNSKTDDPHFKNPQISTNSKRADVIKAFTPTNKISGASKIPNNGGKDITGTSIGNSAFYGCVKY